MAPSTIFRSATRACGRKWITCRRSYTRPTAEFLANYHRAREILEAICEINRELLRRREAL